MNIKNLGIGFLALAAFVVVPFYSAVAEESSDNKRELWGANMESTFAVTAVKDAKKNWTVHFVNSSTDTYNITVQVEQYDYNRKKVGSKTISAKLAPEQILDKPVKVAMGTVNCEVKMQNWTKVEKKQTQEEIDSRIESLKEELSELEKQK